MRRPALALLLGCLLLVTGASALDGYGSTTTSIAAVVQFFTGRSLKGSE